MAPSDTAAVPMRSGWRTYFFVFTGCVEAGELTFGEAESGLCGEDSDKAIHARMDSIVMAFVVDTTVEICRGGTVGDGETVHRMAAKAQS